MSIILVATMKIIICLQSILAFRHSFQKQYWSLFSSNRRLACYKSYNTKGNRTLLITSRPKAHYFYELCRCHREFSILPHFCVKPWEFPANFSEKNHLHCCRSSIDLSFVKGSTSYTEQGETSAKKSNVVHTYANLLR